MGYLTGSIKKMGKQVVGSGKLDLNFVNEGRIFESTNWDEIKKGKPFFFLQVNTPEAEYDIYDFRTNRPERIKWWGEEEHVQYAKPESVVPPAYFPKHKTSNEEWARYLNSVSNMDRRVGVVLKELQKEKLLDDTIIIVFGDNGRVDHRSIHWVYDTGFTCAHDHQVAKEFPAPEDFKPGTVNEAVISLLDLTATTLSLAGVKRPLGMQPYFPWEESCPGKEGMLLVLATGWMMCLFACDPFAASATTISVISSPNLTLWHLREFLQREVLSPCSR